MKVRNVTAFMAALTLLACAKAEQSAYVQRAGPAALRTAAQPPLSIHEAPNGPMSDQPHAPLRAEFTQCVASAAGVTLGTQTCIDAEAEYQQGQLAASLAEARATGDPMKRAALDREQAQWLARKNRDCAWDAKNEGQGQRLDANMCDLQAVADRVSDLRTMNAAKK